MLGTDVGVGAPPLWLSNDLVKLRVVSTLLGVGRGCNELHVWFSPTPSLRCAGNGGGGDFVEE